MKTLVTRNKGKTERYILDDNLIIHNVEYGVIVYKGNTTYGKVAELYAQEWYIEESVTRVQKSLWERIKDAF